MALLALALPLGASRVAARRGRLLLAAFLALAAVNAAVSLLQGRRDLAALRARGGGLARRRRAPSSATSATSPRRWRSPPSRRSASPSDARSPALRFAGVGCGAPFPGRPRRQPEPDVLAGARRRSAPRSSGRATAGARSFRSPPSRRRSWLGALRLRAGARPGARIRSPRSARATGTGSAHLPAGPLVARPSRWRGSGRSSATGRARSRAEFVPHRLKAEMRARRRLVNPLVTSSYGEAHSRAPAGARGRRAWRGSPPSAAAAALPPPALWRAARRDGRPRSAEAALLFGDAPRGSRRLR